MSKPIAIDLFCGAGGLTYGMRKAGIEVVAGIDLDPKMGEVYEANNYPGHLHQTWHAVFSHHAHRLFK